MAFTTTVPGPSALLYYQNTVLILFVAEIWHLEEIPAKLNAIMCVEFGEARRLHSPEADHFPFSIFHLAICHLWAEK